MISGERKNQQSGTNVKNDGAIVTESCSDTRERSGVLTRVFTGRRRARQRCLAVVVGRRIAGVGVDLVTWRPVFRSLFLSGTHLSAGVETRPGVSIEVSRSPGTGWSAAYGEEQVNVCTNGN